MQQLSNSLNGRGSILPWMWAAFCETGTTRAARPNVTHSGGGGNQAPRWMIIGGIGHNSQSSNPSEDTIMFGRKVFYRHWE